MKYEIKGDTLPVVICHLEAGERMITERGSMAWMSPNMKMETSTNGGFGKAFGRMFSGEAMFQNIYTAQGGNGLIAFASSFPGSIKAFEIGPGQEYIFQKKSIPCWRTWSKYICSFSQESGFRTIWRRRIYLAEGIRKWNCICRIRWTCGRIRITTGSADRD